MPGYNSGRPRGRPRKADGTLGRVAREAVIAEVSRLHRYGYNQNEIAERVGVSQVTVHQYLKVIARRYQTASMGDRHVRVLETKAGYADLRFEAMKAWEASKKDAVRVVEDLEPDRQCTVCDGTGRLENGWSHRRDGETHRECGSCGGTGVRKGAVRVTTTTAGQSGDPRFLQVALDAYHAERAMEGLDAPRESRVKAEVVDWAAILAGLPPDGVVPDLVEMEIKKLTEGNGDGIRRVRDQGLRSDEGPRQFIKELPAEERDDERQGP
jgi:hypothetical protein